MELTPDQIAYAITYIECKIRQRKLVAMNKERMEDLTMYCLERLSQKWKRYDPSKTAWKTFMVLCLSCTIKDAFKWYYRQYGRLPLLPIPEGYDTPAPDTDMDAEIDRLFPEPDLNALVKLKYGGASERECLKILKMKKVEYNQSLETVRERLISRKGEEDYDDAG